MGGIATKQFRPSAPPAHFWRGRRMHAAIYLLHNQGKTVPGFWTFDFFGIAPVPNDSRILCSARLGEREDNWIVESQYEAVKWYNLFTKMLGEPDHFNFMGFGQENHDPDGWKTLPSI